MVEDSQNDIMKMVVSQLYLLNLQMAAKDMFGRGYFALAIPEKNAVDNTVWGAAVGTVQGLTPEVISGAPATPAPVGFVPSGS